MLSHLRYWLALPLLIVLACAQAAPSDPPSRVGRLSLLDGDVSMRHEDGRRWEDATLNWPVTAGDEVATGDDGLAEIRIGSSALRLGNRTAVDILKLDDEHIRVRLQEGSVAVRLRSPERAAAIEIETRHGLVAPLGPGQFRVDHDEATISLTSYRGDANFRSDDSDIVVTEGRRADIDIAEGTSVRWDDPEHDDFAEWVLARDERDDALGAPRHVSPEMTGAEDLYEYGDWRTSDEYGEIWYPRDVPSGWAPYRSGRWVSVAPWGWTWVDDAPWGFAPFHYGRWVLLGQRWAWVPGRYVARPVYAPALVVWLGMPDVVLSSGSAYVGWFPLAPREIYLPSYHYSRTYVREINITHVTNVVEITRIERDRRHARYAYRDHRNAVTLVRGDVLRESRPVFRDARRLDDDRWQLPRVATPVPPFDPVRNFRRDRSERSSEKDARSERRAPPPDRNDPDNLRRRQRETARDPDVRSSVTGEDRRPARVEPLEAAPRERRDDGRDHERDRAQRDAERRERFRELRQQDGLGSQPRQSQPEREQRLDAARQQEQERRERDQQQLRQKQLQQLEARRQAEASRRQEQQLEQRSRQDQQQRTDDRRREQELRDRTQRQFEQQQRRDAQERQRFGEQQREHQRDRREQRQAIEQQREQQRDQQRLQQQRSGQEREVRRRGGEPGGRDDAEMSRGRP